MECKTSANSFHPDHWSDLLKSGLTEETILKAGIYSVPPNMISKKLGGQYLKVSSALAFPYNGTDFERYKVFPPYKDNEGHTVKYMQPKGSGVHVFIPPGIESLLSNPSIPLIITEGEKKTLKATQEGICCVGLGGIWNFKEHGHDGLVEEIRKIPMVDRVVEIVPDSDFATNRNVLMAVFRLGKELEKLGAGIEIVSIPSTNNQKIGLDDYLVHHSVQDFKKLKRISLSHQIFKSNEVHKIKSPPGANSVDILSLLESPKIIAVNPAQDFIEGLFLYALTVGDQRFIAFADRTFKSWNEVQKIYRFADANFYRSKFSADGIKRFLNGENVSPAKIYAELQDYFNRFIVYRNPETSGVIALWIMATYVHALFRWFGYLWINSPTRRSGKSQLMELISYVAFNATNGTVQSSDSYLFREVSANSSTLLLDELEHLQNKNKEAFGSTMSILNAGFKKGGKVGRAEKRGNIFKPVEYLVYGPKVLAGINQLADTVVDRCLKITLLRKKKSEQVERFSLKDWELKLERLRDDLYIFGFVFSKEILQLYDHPEDLQIPNELDDRARDIMEPLFALATLVDIDSNDREFKTTRLMQRFALDQAGIRASQEMDDETISQIVAVLSEFELDENGMIFIKPDELLDRFKNCSELAWVQSKKKAGDLMRSLDLKSKSHRLADGLVYRGYLISKERMTDLKERFLPSELSNSDNRSVTTEGKTLENRSVTKEVVTDHKSGPLSFHSHRENPNAVTDVMDQS